MEERLKLTGDAMPCAWTNITRILKGVPIHLVVCLQIFYHYEFPPNLALNLKEPYRDDSFESHLIRPLKMAKPMNERLSKCTTYR